jgi:hypothetical protein
MSNTDSNLVPAKSGELIPPNVRYLSSCPKHVAGVRMLVT